MKKENLQNPMDVECVLKFFEENNGVRFFDTETQKPVLEMLAKKKRKLDFDLWLEQQDKETQLAYKMGEI